MKLVLASDLHGSALYTGQLMKRIEAEAPDRVLLLGDLLYHGPRNDLPEGYAPKQVIPMLNGIKEKIVAVRGNCEAEVDQMVLEFPVMAEYTTLALENGKLLFATHGHHFDPEHLPAGIGGQRLCLRPCAREAFGMEGRHPHSQSGQRVHPEGRHPQLYDLRGRLLCPEASGRHAAGIHGVLRRREP